MKQRDGGFALKCKTCGWRPDDDLTGGVVAAHFTTEHQSDDVQMEMVVVCNRCDGEMAHFATIGREVHYQCDPCHRSRVVKQRPDGEVR